MLILVLGRVLLPLLNANVLQHDLEEAIDMVEAAEEPADDQDVLKSLKATEASLTEPEITPSTCNSAAESSKFLVFNDACCLPNVHGTCGNLQSPRVRRRTRKQVDKSWLSPYFKALGSALAAAVEFNRTAKLSPAQRSCLGFEPCIPVARRHGHVTYHQPLSFKYYEKVMSLLGDVLFFGDSTIRKDIYGLLSLVNMRVGKIQKYGILQAWPYKCHQGGSCEGRTAGAQHGRYISQTPPRSVDTIGYLCYYWAADDVAPYLNKLWKLAKKSRTRSPCKPPVVVYNVGLHLLYAYVHDTAFENATFLAHAREHYQHVARAAHDRKITLILAATNPICSDKYTNEKDPDASRRAKERAPEFMEMLKKDRLRAMSMSDRKTFSISENARMTLQTAEGPILLNKKMRSVAEEFRDSPYVWYWDRWTVLDPSKCDTTPMTDGRHYEPPSFVTAASLLNMLETIAGTTPTPPSCAA